MIIIMKRVELITREEFLNLKEEDFNFRGHEFKEDSFGKINNKIYIIDYGNQIELIKGCVMSGTDITMCILIAVIMVLVIALGYVANKS